MDGQLGTTETVFPASYTQRRLWFLQSMETGSTAYNLLHVTSLDYVPERRALQQALDDLVVRHELLRTRFAWEDGDPVQIVAERGTLPLIVEDARDRHGPEAEKAIGQRISAAVAEPFDLARGQLARAVLGLSGARGAVLALVVHHIILDGQSMRILLEDLEALYRARLGGRKAALPEALIQFGDFAVWQRRILDQRRLDRLTGYWQDRLAGLEEIELPRPPPSLAAAGRGAVAELALPPPVVLRLRSIAAGAGTTLFITLLTAWSILLGRFTGSTDVPVGLPVSGRPKPELERVVGPFVNSVVMRTELAPGLTFRELLRRTTAALADDLTHQDLPFDLLVEHLSWPRTAHHNPIFQVMFQLQVLGLGPAASLAPIPGGTAAPQLGPEALTSQLDLSCILHESAGGGVEGGLVYAPAEVDTTFVTALRDGFLTIVDDAANRPDADITELQIMSDGTEATVRAAGRGPKRRPAHHRIDTWLVQRLAAVPKRTAVVSGDVRVSYQQLAADAAGCARRLRALGAQPGQVVALVMPRSPELVAGVIGVLASGAAFTYIDPATPAARREFILADAGVAAVVVRPGDESLAGDLPGLNLTTGSAGAGLSADWPEPGGIASDAAYVLYTSGSTGEPKGVVIPHSALVNHMHWMLGEFPLGARERVLQRTPLSFDAAIWEVLAPLLAGCTMVLAPQLQGFDPVQLTDTIRQQRVSVIQVVPSLLRALVDTGEFERCSALRRVFCGGEPLPGDLQDAVLAATGAELINLYGPTETTIDATYHCCEPGPPDGRPGSVIPIGRPVSNTTVHVLDPFGGLLPPGVAGQLHIGGAAVGRGYRCRPALDTERFVEHPTLGRVFRTGDLGRLSPSGLFEFAGRTDDQVKVRGFRVEPGEIEATLRQHPAVEDAAVVVQDHGAGDARLVAFVVPPTPAADRARASGDLARASPDERDLRAWLRERLPVQLIPSAISQIDHLPQTRHGKVDRRSLQRRPIGVDETGIRPRTDVERAVCECFAEVLGLPVNDIDLDFFEAGGHSLLIFPLQQRLTEITSRRVDVVDLFQHSTPRRLARTLEARPAPEG